MSRRIRKMGLLLVAALVSLFALVPMVGAAPHAATQNATVKDFEFAPTALSIGVGDTVTWKNEGPNRPHTITASDGAFDSGNLNVGQEFSFKFDKAGTYAYVCKYHDQMKATITVGDAAAAPAQAAPAAQAPTGSIEVGDQALVDGGITVAKITAGQDGWIVAHMDEGGAPGKVIGQTAVKAGDSTNVVIKLSENVPNGGKLWPMLHIDAGTVGTYEFPGSDTPVPGPDGKPVMKQITITAGAAQAPAAQAPAALPRTAGEDAPIGLMLAALALVLAGSVVLAVRRRGV